MRIAILIVMLALAGCGKKKAPQSPGAADSKAMSEGAEEQDKAAPDDADDPQPKSSDPQEGGE